MTPEMIASIVRSAIPQQQPQQRQYSEAELHKMLKRFDATEDLMAQLFAAEGTPQQKAQLFNQIIRGVVQEATTTARYGTEYMVEELLAHLDEPLSFAKDYGQERLFTKLYEGNDGLKMFDGVVRQLVGPLSQDPAFPKGLADRASWLRERIVGEIKKSMPQFDPSKALTEQGQMQQQGNQSPAGGNQQQNAWQQTQGQQQQSPSAAAQSAAQTRPSTAPASGSQGHGGGAGHGATSGGAQTGPGMPTADKPFGF